MNLIYGDIVALLPGRNELRGKVRIGGVLREVSLELVAEPAPGDKVLVCEGIALGKVEPMSHEEVSHVPGHTR
jgi:hydrogenase maturation factor